VKKENIKIVGIMDEEPFDPLTWSGSSYYFFSALRQSNTLVQAIPAQLGRAKDLYYKATNFHPLLSTWRFKYRISTRKYAAMTAKVRRELNSLDDSTFSCLLQVGAWYDATNYNGKISVSYHDGNIASFMNNPYYKKVPFAGKYSREAFRFEKALYSRMHVLFPMSKWLADSFVRDFAVNSKKIFPVGAGVNLPNSAVEEYRVKDYLAPSILFVGKDFQRKGGEYLLKAFSRVKKEIPHATLTIIGPSFQPQDAAISVLGPISKMTNEGIGRIVKAYNNASIFVMPSLYEPFGVAFCEAMAFRTPCIGTNVCAMPEIIEHQKSGLLVPPADERLLAEAMITLLKNPSLCKTMGDEGFRRYKAYFTWEAVTARIVEIISSTS
jgi:glycosyltransferase involved in cell wall biosynthesis